MWNCECITKPSWKEEIKVEKKLDAERRNWKDNFRKQTERINSFKRKSDMRQELSMTKEGEEQMIFWLNKKK